jgi:hypothetical protein
VTELPPVPASIPVVSPSGLVTERDDARACALQAAALWLAVEYRELRGEPTTRQREELTSLALRIVADPW